MPLIIIIVLLSALKYFTVGPFAGISWWWIVCLMAIAFIWFEFLARMLGRDKPRTHETIEKNRQGRVKKTFENDKCRGR